MIELKNGETFNGNLAKCDPYMNIKMTDIICTSQVFIYFPIFWILIIL
jgi:U6 snRNA-associated Sm-like protein LSm4